MRMMMAILASLLGAAFSGAAQAQSCSFGMTGIDFGALALTRGGNTSSSGTLTANCTGTPNQTITICANFGAGSGGAAAGGSPRYMKLSSSQIEYDIFRGNGGQIWGSYLWANSDRPPDLSVTLNGSGQGTLSRSVNARMSNNQPGASPGIHTSSFTGSNALIDYGYASSFACSATPSSRAQQVPFTVQVNNVVSCSVAATAMNFGTVAVLTAARDATSTITVTCSKGTNYTVGLSNGTGGGTGPTQRRMMNSGGTGYILYGIYRNAARNQPWGDTVGVDTASGKSNGQAKALTAYGRIPVQTTPSADTYTDTIIATITY